MRIFTNSQREYTERQLQYIWCTHRLSKFALKLTSLLQTALNTSLILSRCYINLALQQDVFTLLRCRISLIHGIKSCFDYNYNSHARLQKIISVSSGVRLLLLSMTARHRLNQVFTMSQVVFNKAITYKVVRF